MNSRKDVESRVDIEAIVQDFYNRLLADPIVGFIFTDVVGIDLPSHLPIIVDFWSDIVLTRTNSMDSGKLNQPATEQKLYKGNALRKHMQLNKQIALKSGHFTRWLYLFNQAVNAHNIGPNADLMKYRAEGVAQSISAAISDQKKSSMRLSLRNE